MLIFFFLYFHHERPKKPPPNGAKKHTHQLDNSMTESAQWGHFSENIKKIIQIFENIQLLENNQTSGY